MGHPGAFDDVDLRAAILCGTTWDQQNVDLDEQEATLGEDTLCPELDDTGRCVRLAGQGEGDPSCDLFPNDPPD